MAKRKLNCPTAVLTDAEVEQRMLAQLSQQLSGKLIGGRHKALLAKVRTATKPVLWLQGRDFDGLTYTEGTSIRSAGRRVGLLLSIKVCRYAGREGLAVSVRKLS
jgi:hypothetical protein